MTHTITKTETGYGIQNLRSGCIYGAFDTFAEAMSALCEAGLANQLAVSDAAQY